MSEVCLDWFDVEEVIGKGEYSDVHRAVDKLTKRLWAIKKVSKAYCLHKKCVAKLRREIEIMSNIHHEYEAS